LFRDNVGLGTYNVKILLIKEKYIELSSSGADLIIIIMQNNKIIIDITTVTIYLIKALEL